MRGITPEQKLLNVIKAAQAKLRLKKELRIFTKVNIVLIALIIVILAVFLKDIVSSNYSISQLNVTLPPQRGEVLPAALEPKEKLNEDEKMAVKKEKPLISKDDLIKDFVLLGVVEGKRNQAVIEDKKAKKTFFLYKGDMIKEFKVYDIKDGKVILDYKGERIELKI